MIAFTLSLYICVYFYLGAATVLEGGGGDGGFPMFRTGSGKSVMVSQSSIRKAAAVLEGENIKNGKFSTFLLLF